MVSGLSLRKVSGLSLQVPLTSRLCLLPGPGGRLPSCTHSGDSGSQETQKGGAQKKVEG